MRPIPRCKPRIVAPFNPAYKIIRHPRAYSKPISCLRGQHKFNKKNIKIVNGLPHYVCSKCGDAIGIGLHDKTWTRKDLIDSKKIIHPKHKPRTTKQRAIDTWEKREYLRSKGLTDKQINKMYRKYMAGLI